MDSSKNSMRRLRLLFESSSKPIFSIITRLETGLPKIPWSPGARSRIVSTSTFEGCTPSRTSPLMRSMKSSSLPDVTSDLPHEPIRTIDTSSSWGSSASLALRSLISLLVRSRAFSRFGNFRPLAALRCSRGLAIARARSRIPRWRLDNPGNIQTPLQQRREQFFMLLSERSVVQVRRQRTHVEMSQSGAKRVEQIATYCHGLVDRPSVSNVKAETGLGQLREPSIQLIDRASIVLTGIHVLQDQLSPQ